MESLRERQVLTGESPTPIYSTVSRIEAFILQGTSCSAEALVLRGKTQQSRLDRSVLVVQRIHQRVIQ